MTTRTLTACPHCGSTGAYVVGMLRSGRDYQIRDFGTGEPIDTDMDRGIWTDNKTARCESCHKRFPNPDLG